MANLINVSSSQQSCEREKEDADINCSQSLELSQCSDDDNAWLASFRGTKLTSEEEALQTQWRELTAQVLNQYYGREMQEADPTSERATQDTRKMLKDRDLQTNSIGLNSEAVEKLAGILDILSGRETSILAVGIQKQCTADFEALIANKKEIMNNALLTANHMAKVVAGDFQQRREIEVAIPGTKADLSGNAALAGRRQRNAYQQLVRANSFQFGTCIGWKAPLNSIVNSGYNIGFGLVANASGGWGRGVNMNQNTGQNYRLPGKRRYVPNAYGIQQMGIRLRFDAIGPVAAAASTAAPKQE
ncbi:MAG: hypothetical protein EZS28_030590 [Streblomastix strix]|uniref:Uncharacterized protein n=1 Tax=Streblomastix strix TaxID=222440 RepID=A0A5J4UV02_9EUKA|nr:MAG: hypothetical protein EZS28_030590 [Streblomastix strix]